LVMPSFMPSLSFGSTLSSQPRTRLSKSRSVRVCRSNRSEERVSSSAPPVFLQGSVLYKCLKNLVLPERIELSTSPLPTECFSRKCAETLASDIRCSRNVPRIGGGYAPIARLQVHKSTGHSPQTMRPQAHGLGRWGKLDRGHSLSYACPMSRSIPTQPMTLGNMLDNGLELIIGCEECGSTSVADVAAKLSKMVPIATNAAPGLECAATELRLSYALPAGSRATRSTGQRTGSARRRTCRRALQEIGLLWSWRLPSALPLRIGVKLSEYRYRCPRD
jgi:hypothetical protein